MQQLLLLPGKAARRYARLTVTPVPVLPAASTCAAIPGWGRRGLAKPIRRRRLRVAFTVVPLVAMWLTSWPRRWRWGRPPVWRQRQAPRSPPGRWWVLVAGLIMLFIPSTTFIQLAVIAGSLEGSCWALPIARIPCPPVARVLLLPVFLNLPSVRRCGPPAAPRLGPFTVITIPR
jgi:hypothetical protein